MGDSDGMPLSEAGGQQLLHSAVPVVAPVAADGAEYLATILEPGSLGIKLGPIDAHTQTGAVVEGVQPNGLMNRSCPRVAAYDRIVGVGGVDMTGQTFAQIIDRIKANGRPLQLRMQVCRVAPGDLQS